MFCKWFYCIKIIYKLYINLAIYKPKNIRNSIILKKWITNITILKLLWELFKFYNDEVFSKYY